MMTTHQTEPTGGLDTILEEITHLYQSLVGQTFKGACHGKYVSVVGTLRDQIEVIVGPKDIFNTISGILERSDIRVWKGFTDCTDSYMKYDWNPMMFVRSEMIENKTECCVVGPVHDFQIVNFNMFQLQTTQYQFGVDFTVHYLDPVQAIVKVEPSS